MIVANEDVAEQLFDPRDNANPRLQAYQMDAENSHKLRRAHFDYHVKFLADWGDAIPSLNVIQSPKWWKRGKPAVFQDEDDIAADGKRCR